MDEPAMMRKKNSAACRAQRNDGQIRLNGRPLKVLRDTWMIMNRDSIPDSMVIPGSSGLAAAGKPHSDRRCAVGQCLPGFPVLQRTLQSDVCQLPCIHCDNW